MSKIPTLYAVGTTTNPLRRLDSIADILAEPLPTYAMRPLLAHRAVHVLYGDSQTGKTFLALDMAATIATGGLWDGRAVAAAPVLYVSAEGNGGLGKRLRALVRKYPGVTAAPIRVLRQSIDLLNDQPALLERALAFAGEHGGRLGLVVLDTLAQTIGGRDENGPDMAGYVGRAADLAAKTGAAVLIVHHAGKDAGRGARGHSSLRGNVDAIYRVTVDDGGQRTVSAEKTRDDTIAPWCYRLDVHSVGRDQDGIEQTSCTVALGGTPAVQRRALSGAAQKLLYRLAGEVAEAAGHAGRIAANGRPIIDYDRLVATWQATRDAAGAKRTAPSYVLRPLEALVDAGYLVAVGEQQWTLA